MGQHRGGHVMDTKRSLNFKASPGGLRGRAWSPRSQLYCVHPTVDRCWVAGLSRVASVPVLAVTAKLMKTTTGSSRP